MLGLLKPFQRVLVPTSRKLPKPSEGLKRASRGRIVGLRRHPSDRSKAGMGWVMAKGAPQSSIRPPQTPTSHLLAKSCYWPSKATISFDGGLISL